MEDEMCFACRTDFISVTCKSKGNNDNYLERNPTSKLACHTYYTTARVHIIVSWLKKHITVDEKMVCKFFSQ